MALTQSATPAESLESENEKRRSQKGTYHCPDGECIDREQTHVSIELVDSEAVQAMSREVSLRILDKYRCQTYMTATNPPMSSDPKLLSIAGVVDVGMFKAVVEYECIGGGRACEVYTHQRK